MGRYAILGTGAIGGYYGACLQRGGHAVHYLLHRDYDWVQRHGLRVDSVQGDFTLPQVQAHATVDTIPPVDGVIIALKTTQNDLLATLLPPLLGPDTAVITLQNGFAIEAAIAPLLTGQPLMGGLCFVCANKIGPGHIHHLDYGDILLGLHAPEGQAGGISPRLTAIADDFRQGGLTLTLTPDLPLARWRKLVWNVPFNSLSVVLNATTDAMIQDPDIVALAESLMAEVVGAAQAWGQHHSPGAGRALPQGLIPQMIAHTRTMKPYRTSMKIDYDEGRPLEVEAILGNPLRAAQGVGYPTPQMAMLYHQVKACDRWRQGDGTAPTVPEPTASVGTATGNRD